MPLGYFCVIDWSHQQGVTECGATKTAPSKIITAEVSIRETHQWVDKEPILATDMKKKIIAKQQRRYFPDKCTTSDVDPHKLREPTMHTL